MSGGCKVDFYVLGSESLDADQLACTLAMKAWVRGHRVDVVTADQEATRRLDMLMWDYPVGRFLPHEAGANPEGVASVRILDQAPDTADVVINLTSQPMPGAMSYTRLLEIVPNNDAERQASRDKYRAYAGMGIKPAKHEIKQGP